MKTSVLICTTLLSISLSAFGTTRNVSENPTAAAVIELIIQKTAAPTIQNTVDVIKEGDPQTPVTGIITTMFATMDVLKEAVAKKCNLIISHEPLYYNHLDSKEQFTNDPVFLEKQRFIIDNKLVVWRFHDYIHRMNPDGIGMGMVAKLGYEKYKADGSLNRFIIPETKLENLLQDMKQKFPAHAFHVIGNPSMTVSKVAFAAGAPGSAAHFNALKENDVFIAGEVPQWETYEYARDAVQQGKSKAVIFIGHINSEEAGMDYCATWLKSFLNDLPIHFVSSGSSYWTY
jgi:putative NIF3 family GTP cyclohydrolase 1 type 2